MKRRGKCNIDQICDECKFLVRKNKHFEANLNFLNQKPIL